MASPKAATGRPTTPLPGQATPGERIPVRRINAFTPLGAAYPSDEAPQRPPQRQNSNGSIRSGLYPAVGAASRTGYGAPPPSAGREAVTGQLHFGTLIASKETQAPSLASGLEAEVQEKARRRSSGSPEPGRAARTSWTSTVGIGGPPPRRLALGSDRARISPMSSRSTCPAGISSARQSEVNTKRSGSPEDRLSPRHERPTEELWDDYNASLRKMREGAAFLKGLVKQMRSGTEAAKGTTPSKIIARTPANTPSKDSTPGATHSVPRWATSTAAMPRQGSDSDGCRAVSPPSDWRAAKASLQARQGNKGSPRPWPPQRPPAPAMTGGMIPRMPGPGATREESKVERSEAVKESATLGNENDANAMNSF
eukprot:TRINITY_DN35887_c0_g1_i2.p1 TRINITY_DN35887_c0_g1~~TRINITY_DN35887_c0_g1_i2.p1  ORF type:complete len:369 (-),score=71.00 TRINITY_DN35887_c0_g1_i2:363-1469(-)